MGGSRRPCAMRCSCLIVNVPIGTTLRPPENQRGHFGSWSRGYHVDLGGSIHTPDSPVPHYGFQDLLVTLHREC